MAAGQNQFILAAFNPFPIAAAPQGTEAIIGFAATALGNALLVSLAGAPVVVAVNLDLADDEVAIGGPNVAGVRQLFRGIDNGDGTNQLETKPTAGATGAQGQVSVTAAGVTILAASATAREVLFWNSGTRDVDIFFSALGAFGAGARLPSAPAGAIVPIRVAYRGAITAIRSGVGAVNGIVSFVTVRD